MLLLYIVNQQGKFLILFFLFIHDCDTMEQRFTVQGDQYKEHPDTYPNRRYILDSTIPSGENQWNQNVPTDNYNEGYSANQGLDNFHFYYASNTGIPGAYRPRPVKTQTPLFHANGLQQLFYDTQNLQYSTQDGKQPPIPVPYANDPVFESFEIMDGITEYCGCGGGPLLPLL